jgi:acetyltransferase-like isoleucine patch superfamily enzyme
MRDLLLLLCTFLPSALRLKVWSWMGFQVGAGARVAPLSVVVAGSIDIGPGAVIGPLTLIYRPARIRIGQRARIAAFVRIIGYGELNLEEQTFVALGCLIDLQERHRFALGARSQIGPRGTYYTHGATGLIFNRDYPIRIGDIVIGSDCWIGMACVVYPNVKIGSGSLITPGLVISSDVPADSMLLPPAEPWRCVPVKFVRQLPGGSDDTKLQLMRDWVERLERSHHGQLERSPDWWVLRLQGGRTLLLRIADAQLKVEHPPDRTAVWTLDWEGPATLPVFCFRKLTVFGKHTAFAEELASHLCEACGTHFVFENDANRGGQTIG